MRSRCLMIVAVTGCILTSGGPVTAGNFTPDSRITAVTVYPGSARVTREAVVQLTPGTHTVEFGGIVPQFDENSLSVGGRGRAGVLIHGATVKTEHLAETADARRRGLEEQLQSVTDQLAAVAEQQRVVQQQAEFLDSVKLFSGNQIPKDLVTGMPSSEQLSSIMTFIGDNAEQLSARRLGLVRQQRELEKEQQRLGQELAMVHSQTRNIKRSVIVELECQKAGDLAVEVSFLVYGANWRPVYDARAQIDDKRVELNGYAQVQQKTGEDWTSVALELSTSRPTVSGQMPYVAPWILQPYQPQMARKGKMERGFADEAVVGGAQYEPYYLSADSLASSATPAAPEEERDASMAYSAAQHKGISVVFAVPQAATIPSDGSDYKFPVSTQELAAEFSYSTYPRANTFAYLGSRVRNSKDLQLLAGQVNLFLDGDYVGKSAIQNVGPGEEFDLFLGIDENVKVKREELKRNVDDVLIGGIKSPNTKMTVRQKITVENYKQRPVNVIVFEAMPVSENDRIKVRLDEVEPRPAEKDWNDRKGVWRWEIEIQPGGKQEIVYSYLLEYPRDMKVADL